MKPETVIASFLKLETTPEITTPSKRFRYEDGEGKIYVHFDGLTQGLITTKLGAENVFALFCAFYELTGSISRTSKAIKLFQNIKSSDNDRIYVEKDKLRIVRSIAEELELDLVLLSSSPETADGFERVFLFDCVPDEPNSNSNRQCFLFRTKADAEEYLPDEKHTIIVELSDQKH